MGEFYFIFKDFFHIIEEESENGIIVSLPPDKTKPNAPRTFITKKRWQAQVRQWVKINSCSSREAVYIGKNLRKTFLNMHNSTLQPIFYCEELAEENIACDFTGNYRHGHKYIWKLVDKHTPVRYTTPFSLNQAKANLQFRRGGYRRPLPVTHLF
tara:strand:+ start:976 stop:1440 length:465 start_codon:yes stop_codon:yes gene_type:complete